MENKILLNSLLEELCKGSFTAYNKLSYCLANRVDLENKPNVSELWINQVVSLISAEARKGNTPAMVLLGNVYLNGWGIPSDVTKALEYGRRSASLGDAGGEVILGYCYLNGYGVVVDYDRAMYWFKMALEKGHSMAANNIGVMYEEGLGVKKDLVQALKYYQQAAKQNSTLGIKNLERLSKLPVKKL
jgi:TPR repeat protein